MGGVPQSGLQPGGMGVSGGGGNPVRPVVRPVVRGDTPVRPVAGGGATPEQDKGTTQTGQRGNPYQTGQGVPHPPEQTTPGPVRLLQFMQNTFVSSNLESLIYGHCIERSLPF